MDNEKLIEENVVNTKPSETLSNDMKPEASKIRSRSVSLSKIPAEKSSPEKNKIKGKNHSKRKRETPSPKGEVMDKRKLFEEKLARKYQAQRKEKELVRERCKQKRFNVDDDSQVHGTRIY